MALMKGKTSKALELYEVPEVPDTIPRDRWGRPLIEPLDGGKPMPYTRASTLGKAIEDTYHLNKWLQRSVAYGLSRRPDLVALVAAVATNEGDDRQPLDELCEKAHEAAKGDQGANIGTALHKLSERRDAGEDLSYLSPILFEAVDAYSEQMRNFEVLASETFVVCDPLRTAGSFDRVVRLKVPLEFRHAVKGQVVLPAGTVAVLDLKTGKVDSAKYWGPTYGVQQCVYACGVPYRHGQGRLDWEELLGEGSAPSADWAILLHVPSDSPSDAGLVIVDLALGAAMGELAVEVREARKNRALMSEAYPVPAAAEDPTTGEDAEDEVVTAARLLEWIRSAKHEGEVEGLWAGYESNWTDEHTTAVQARLAELETARAQAERPAQVVMLELAAALRQAPDEAALDALWETNQEVWRPVHTQMVKARLAELGAVPA